MIKTSCGPSCAFSLISLLVMVQCGHNIHQKKALQLLNGINYIIHDYKEKKTSPYINSDFLPSFFPNFVCLFLLW